jgi:hypothetical protein
VGRDENLASSLTLCRFENWASPQSCWDISRVLVEIFIESFSALPAELILDFDGTDDLIHGDQPGAVFHGYYDHHCFLPLYVFCADKLLAAYRRPGDTDGAQHAWGILALLVKRLRQVWPQVHIVFRGDSGFCRDQMLRCCERRGVSYIVGPVPNSRLNEMAAPWIDQAEAGFEHSGQKQGLFAELAYAARSWKQSRRIVVKAEHTALGANPRYIVTNLPGEPQTLYEKIYCARGEIEIRIKEQQLYLLLIRPVE